MSLKKTVSEHLSDLADLMEFSGENKFKIAAFRNGANIVRRLDRDLEEMIEDGSLKKTKGIGKGLYSVILEFYEKGTSTEFEKYIKNIPEGIFDLFKIKGLGPGKIKKLYENLGITNIEELERACSGNKVAGLKGFGSKTQEKIIAELDRLKRIKGKVLLSEALQIAEIISGKLKILKSVIEIQPTGEVRRIREIISKIEFVIFAKSLNEFLTDIANSFYFKELHDKTSRNIFRLKTDYEIEILLHVVTNKEDFTRTVFETTGSNEFLEKLNLSQITGKVKDEKSIFKTIGINFIIPEMREEAFFDAPEQLRKNSKLTLDDFKGFLHFHTVWSDGTNTLEEMVNAIENYGFEYCAVCDHSKAAYYANGLNEIRLEEQKKELVKLQETTKIKLLHGSEVDILKNGDLDFPDDILKSLDFVVASVHSIFNLSEEEMTKRIIKAIENEHTNLIAHPTGRLLLRRDGYELNIKKIIDACACNNVAIEINANPYRLDLDWRNLYYAREKGCKISINPDAHSIDDIDYIKYGIMIARKGGTQPDEVINTFTLDDFLNFINK